jgi:hypothetical protein
MAERQRNAYTDLFEAVFLSRQAVDPVPYIRQKHDFIQLFELFKKGENAKWPITLERWQRALENYFLSEVGHRTIADLCARFSTFYKGPLDRFGKPRVVADPVGEQKPQPWAMWLLKECWELSRGTNEKQVVAAIELIEYRAISITSAEQAKQEIERIKAL